MYLRAQEFLDSQVVGTPLSPPHIKGLATLRGEGEEVLRRTPRAREAFLAHQPLTTKPGDQRIDRSVADLRKTVDLQFLHESVRMRRRCCQQPQDAHVQGAAQQKALPSRIQVRVDYHAGHSTWLRMVRNVCTVSDGFVEHDTARWGGGVRVGLRAAPRHAGR